MICGTSVDNRLYSYGKSNQALTSSKMKRRRNFTHDGFLATGKIVGHAYILLHIARRNLFHSSYWII